MVDIEEIREVLLMAQGYIYNDMDAICDEDCYNDASAIVERIDRVLEKLQ